MTIEEYYANFVELPQYANVPGTHSRCQAIQFRSNFSITTLVDAYGISQRIHALWTGEKGMT
ncbi:hypothetical protein TorRG33x02_330000, partial [Trema orientale]